MTRQRSNERKRKAGVKAPTNKSRTSPAYYKSRDHYKQHKKLGKLYSRHHAKRKALKAKLTSELGLPLDTKFIFRYSLKDRPDLAGRDRISISSGTVVVINKLDLSIVLVVKCIPFEDMEPTLRERYDHSISTTFLHARARNQCKIHSSIQPDGNEDDEMKPLEGWMGCGGWRGGCEKDKSLGAYSMNSFTSSDIVRIQTDKERMTEFHHIMDFWAGRFSSLSLFVFKTNLALAFQAKIPGFDQLKWQLTPNGLVFASNLVVTCDGFCNRPHTDKDHSRYAFGMWALIIRKTGLPYDKVKGVKIGNKERVKLGEVRGTRFRYDDFDVEVSVSECNGVCDILWDTTCQHYTAASIAYDGNGEIIPHKKGIVTMYGSSAQISQDLVNRIKLLGEKKNDMTESQWEKYCASRVKDYEEECINKIEKALGKADLSISKPVTKKQRRK